MDEGEDIHKTVHGSTLFVSNLPYTATSVDLQTLFSDIAPVRSAFVVAEQGTGVSKGVGYVSFSLKEDAVAAYDSISKNGIELVGRKLRIQWAEIKKHKDSKQNREPRKPNQPRQKSQATHDPLAIRTIVISGLPASMDAKVLWKKIRKYKGVENVEWPIKNSDESNKGEEDRTTAHVLFSTPAQASEAVNKLHAHVFKGSLLSVTLKKRMDNLAKPMVTSRKGMDAAVTAVPSHASRLIVRNIPFNVTEQDVRVIFLPYGPIYSIHIPTIDSKQAAESTTAASKKPRTKGFAFVWMLSKKDAEKAIQGCNGTVMRAGTAHSLIADKQKKKKERRLELKQARALSKEGEEEDEKEADSTERVIAVDWALSKDRWEEEKTKMEDVEMDDPGLSSDNESNSDSGGGSLGLHSDSGDESGESHPNSDEDDDDNNEENGVKPQLPAPEIGTTVFVRNVPFEATEDELRTLFRSFGPLRYARITTDPETGRSRGTGFACFWNKEDADRVIRQSELLHAETTAQTSIQKKNPFSLPSILTPDPSSSLAQSLVLHGRTLDVVTAVTRDVAGKLKEDNEKAKQKVDKRNMYLLKEGVILPNSPSAENLTAAEVERRTSSFNARRALLKSNPSLYISKTRLSVRQIPIFVTERMLKRLSLHSIKAFNAEVKQGTRSPLDDDNDDDDELGERPASELGGDIKEQSETGSKRKRKFKESAVKQAKIVRQSERIDPITGKGKSKGYGFVEMQKHSDALKFLRWANNNPVVGELLGGRWWKEELEILLKVEKAKDVNNRDEARVKKLKEELEKFDRDDGKTGKKSKGTLIVEFSIENIQVVQRRNARQKDNKEKVTAESKSIDEKKKRKRVSESDSKDHDEDLPSKKRRVSQSNEKDDHSENGKTSAEKKKFANPMGSIIGRKRKERRKGKKN